MANEEENIWTTQNDGQTPKANISSKWVIVKISHSSFPVEKGKRLDYYCVFRV